MKRGIGGSTCVASQKRSISECGPTAAGESHVEISKPTSGGKFVNIQVCIITLLAARLNLHIRSSRQYRRKMYQA